MTGLPPYSIPEKVKKRRTFFLGCVLDPLSMAETVELIEEAMVQRRVLQHVVVNVAKLVYLQDNRALYDDVMGSDLINVDGMGVVWGARFMGLQIPERVAGVDLMDRILALCAEKGFRPYILGAKPDVLRQAVDNIRAKYPALEFAGVQDGYYDRDREQEVMQAIRDSRPDCLFIAISSPHKERIMSCYKEFLEIPFIMGVGGSVDVMAGHVDRAPGWMQVMGAEWVYRLWQEPRRMWKRYLVTNSRYAWLLLKARLGLYRGPAFGGQSYLKNL